MAEPEFEPTWPACLQSLHTSKLPENTMHTNPLPSETVHMGLPMLWEQSPLVSEINKRVTGDRNWQVSPRGERGTLSSVTAPAGHVSGFSEGALTNTNSYVVLRIGCHETRPLYGTVTLMELSTELRWIYTGCLVLRLKYFNEMQSINTTGYNSHDVIKIFKCEKLLVCLRVKPKANLRKLIWIFLKQ